MEKGYRCGSSWSARPGRARPRWRELSRRVWRCSIDLDAINWHAGWRDLTRHDPAEFVRRVTEAIQANRRVVDASCGPVRDIVWTRATHLVWLDHPRPVIMARVIRRSLLRAGLRTELWAGNR